jgi:hypothetical protein
MIVFELHCMQYSRLKPSYKFHFEGLSNFSPLVEELVQIQDINPRIQKWNIKLISNLCMYYMVHVSSTMWSIKNQPSNSISYSNNVIRLLVLVVHGHIILRTSSDVFIFYLGLRFEGLFWERYILKGRIGVWRALKTSILSIDCMCIYVIRPFFTILGFWCKRPRQVETSMLIVKDWTRSPSMFYVFSTHQTLFEDVELFLNIINMCFDSVWFCRIHGISCTKYDI